MQLTRIVTGNLVVCGASFLTSACHIDLMHMCAGGEQSVV